MARSRRGPKILFPERIESSYMARMKMAVNKMVEASEALTPADRGDRFRVDVGVDAWLIAIRRLSASTTVAVPGLDRTAAAVDGFATAQQKTGIKAVAPLVKLALIDQALAPPMAAVRNAWVRANVKLIKTIGSKYFEEIEGLVQAGLKSGRSIKSMGKEIARRGEVAQSRGRLIARDQIAKLNSQISERRQTDAGITSYKWRTVGDERVRETHEANEGKTFKWSDPPATGHPGSEIQCRCIAEPIFDA